MTPRNFFMGADLIAACSCLRESWAYNRQLVVMDHVLSGFYYLLGLQPRKRVPHNS